MLDNLRADVARWTFTKAVPSAYSASSLNALASEALIETLEVSVGGLTISFGPSIGGHFRSGRRT